MENLAGLAVLVAGVAFFSTCAVMLIMGVYLFWKECVILPLKARYVAYKYVKEHGTYEERTAKLLSSVNTIKLRK